LARAARAVRPARAAEPAPESKTLLEIADISPSLNCGSPYGRVDSPASPSKVENRPWRKEAAAIARQARRRPEPGRPLQTDGGGRADPDERIEAPVETLWPASRALSAA
jgi:hypothetical protein